MTQTQVINLCAHAQRLFDEGNFSDAEDTCGRIVETSGAPAQALHLAAIAEKRGRIAVAVEFLERAAAVSPTDAAIHADLGFIYLQAGQIDKAARTLGRATELDPQLVEPWVHLGDLRLAGRHIQAAAEAYCRAALLRPDDSQVFARIGGNCNDVNEVDALFSDCLSLLAEAEMTAGGWFNFGFAAQLRGSVDIAIEAYRKVLAIEPGHVLARNNLGAALRDTGQIDAAVECFRTAAEAITPAAMTCHSNLLYLLHFQDTMDPVSLRKEHERWKGRYAAGLWRQDRPFLNDRSPDRRLRIGYVSPNFYQHSVGRFLTQLFQYHNRQTVETFAYASVRNPDALTDRLRESSDRWIDALGMSDESLAEQVREDRIDILVDLTMHMRDQRLLCFAQACADSGDLPGVLFDDRPRCDRLSADRSLPRPVRRNSRQTAGRAR